MNIRRRRRRRVGRPVTVQPGDAGRVVRNAEKVCLRFNKAEVEYLPQRQDGSLGTPVRTTLER